MLLSDKITKIFLLGIIGLLPTCKSPKHTIAVNEVNKCVTFFDSKIQECELLQILSDSTVWNKYIPNRNCLNEILYKLSAKSNIKPNWVCDFAGCNYYDYSMDKSIFKVDLLQWMRYFHCSDSVRLKLNTKGQFNKEDLSTIKLKEIQGTPIDTMILYLK